jgi:hypothetical protein
MKRYLAIPGALMLTAAFVRAAVAAEWDRTGVVLAGAGALVVLATVIWNRDEVVEWIRDPRGVFAVTTGISVALVVAVLVMLNIAVWYNPWSVDLTASGRNDVSQGTRELLSRLDVEVSLRQFGRTPDSGIERLLRGFARETRRIRVEFVDVDRDRASASRYGVIKLGTVVAMAGDKFRKVEDVNEQGLVTAVLQVSSDVEGTVCFVTGHGERGLADTGAEGLSVLASVLEVSNYRSERVSLLEGEVPRTCSALVVAGPREDWTAPEIARLHTYFESHGRVALLVEPGPAAPSLAEWLHPLGVVPGPGVVVDTSGAGQSVGGGPRTPLALRYGDHPVTRGFAIATMYSGARPLQIAAPEFGQKPTALAETGPRSFATTSFDPGAAFLAGRDTPGPLTLAVATVIGPLSEPEEQARLAVFGDSDFISNAFIRRQGNRDFFLRSLAWLMGEQEAAIVAVDDRQNRRIELTEATRAWMYIINLGLLPLAPLLAGVAVYLRSRR